MAAQAFRPGVGALLGATGLVAGRRARSLFANASRALLLCAASLCGGGLAFFAAAGESWREAVLGRFFLPPLLAQATLLAPALAGLVIFSGLILQAETRGRMAPLRWRVWAGALVFAVGAWWLDGEGFAVWAGVACLFVAACLEAAHPTTASAGFHAKRDHAELRAREAAVVALVALALLVWPVPASSSAHPRDPAHRWLEAGANRAAWLAADGRWTRELDGPTFDAVILESGGEQPHAHRRDAQRALRRALARLVPNGRLVVQEPAQSAIAPLVDFERRTLAGVGWPAGRRLRIQEDSVVRTVLLFGGPPTDWLASRPPPDRAHAMLDPEEIQ